MNCKVCGVCMDKHSNKNQCGWKSVYTYTYPNGTSVHVMKLDDETFTYRIGGEYSRKNKWLSGKSLKDCKESGKTAIRIQAQRRMAVSDDKMALHRKTMSEIDTPKDKSGNKCAICGTIKKRRSRHHVIPREIWRRENRKGKNVTMLLCFPCHKLIHNMFTNEELANDINSKKKVRLVLRRELK